MTAAEIADLRPDEIKILRMMQPNKKHFVSTLYPTLQRLQKKDLIQVALDGFRFWTRLTDLGLAVRRELEGKEDVRSQ